MKTKLDSLLQQYQTANASLDAAARSNYRTQAGIDLSVVNLGSFFPAELVEALASPAPDEEDYWLALMKLPEMRSALFPNSTKLYGYHVAYQSMPDYFAPVRAAYQQAVSCAMATGRYTALAKAHVAAVVASSNLLHLEQSMLEINTFLTRLAERAKDATLLQQLAAHNCKSLNAKILEHAPALEDPAALAWFLSQYVARSSYATRPDLRPKGLVDAVLSNPNLTMASKARARDLFAMQYIQSGYMHQENIAPLSALNSEVRAAGYPVPDLIGDALLFQTNRRETYTGVITIALGLNEKRIIDAHISRAKDRNMLNSLIDLIPMLSTVQWQDLMLTIVEARDDGVAPLIAMAIKDMPVGSLSPILPQFLNRIIPRALPEIAPVTSSADWEMIISFYKKRSPKAVHKSILAFIEKTPLAIRPQLPKQLLVTVFKSADPETRAQALSLMGTMTHVPPTTAAVKL